jgi:hypothetical protein
MLRRHGGTGGGDGDLQRCCFVVGDLLHTQELNINYTCVGINNSMIPCPK